MIDSLDFFMDKGSDGVNGSSEIQGNSYEIIFRITEQCNLDCNYCFYKDDDIPHYDLNDIKRVIDTFPLIEKNLYIYFHGGEATYHPDVKEILLYIQKVLTENDVTYFLELQTNMLQTTNWYKELATGIDNFAYSASFHPMYNTTKFDSYYKKVLELHESELICRVDFMLEKVDYIDDVIECGNVMLNGPLNDKIDIITKFHSIDEAYTTTSLFKDALPNFYNKYNSFFKLVEDGKTRLVDFHYLSNNEMKFTGMNCAVGRDQMFINGDGEILFCYTHLREWKGKRVSLINLLDDIDGFIEMTKQPIICPFEKCDIDFWIPKWRT